MGVVGLVGFQVDAHQERHQIVATCEPCAVGVRLLRHAEPGWQRTEPPHPRRLVQQPPFGGVQHRPRQPPRLAEDIGVRAFRHHLFRYGLQQHIHLRAIHLLIEHQLQQPVGTMRHAVPPPLDRIETAIVAHRCQVGGGARDHVGAFLDRHPGRDAVGARHLRQHQRGEGRTESRGVLLTEHRVQAVAQGAALRHVHLARAQPGAEAFVSHAIAQGGIGIGQARRQPRHQGGAHVVGNGELLFAQQLQRSRIGALGRTCRLRRRGEQQTRQHPPCRSAHRHLPALVAMVRGWRRRRASPSTRPGPHPAGSAR